jgi:hypothetical protein
MCHKYEKETRSLFHHEEACIVPQRPDTSRSIPAELALLLLASFSRFVYLQNSKFKLTFETQLRVLLLKIYLTRNSNLTTDAVTLRNRSSYK